MQKIFLAVGCLLQLSFSNAQSSVRIEIKDYPSYQDTNADLYLAGSFHSWRPGDSVYRFRRDGNGKYYINLQLVNGKYEYKITRGEWSKVECKKGGRGIANRVLMVPSDTTIQLSIEEWSDHFPPPSKTSSASKNVYIIDTAFYIPQLKRTRRIWVYLPEGYASSRSRYPVLYMHDGQNLFDNATSYSGEWGIDEYLDSTGYRKCIVVGIDNGGDKRLNEYGPYNFTFNTELYKSLKITAEGSRYADFLVKTLKPYIDKKYRTLKDKTNTAIAGSSMGGLISMYAVLKYPAVFGYAGVFSPAFWAAMPILDDIKKKGKNVNSHIYFYAGKQESESMVTDMMKVFAAMSKVSKSKMEMVIRDGGQHNEARWRLEFPLFYKWLMR